MAIHAEGPVATNDQVALAAIQAALPKAKVKSMISIVAIRGGIATLLLAMLRKQFTIIVSSLALVAGAFTAPAFAQTPPATLPPALQAAVNSGNQSAIVQAINTLSAGNNVQKGELAKLVAAQAERLASVNPQFALVAAQAAAGIVAVPAVYRANPSAANSVAVSLSKVATSPAVVAFSPGSAGQIASDVRSILALPGVTAANPGAAQLAANAVSQNQQNQQQSQTSQNNNTGNFNTDQNAGDASGSGRT